jgi:hypothetical protein
LNRHVRCFFRALLSVRFAIVLLAAFVPMCIPSLSEAKQNCPWLNEATASGALEGTVTAKITYANRNKDDATCEFTHQNGSATTELRVEVETLSGAPGAYGTYAARCGSNGVQLRAIGNEAVTCSFEDTNKKKWVSEQVVGRVRDHVFTVRVSSNAGSADRSVLREKARKLAEQVAGFLF